MTARGYRLGLVAVGVAAVCAIALPYVWHDRDSTYASRPVGVMGTETTLQVVLPSGDEAKARRVLQAGEDALRHVESLMSTWIDMTEIARFNAAEAGTEMPLSESTRDVLALSRRLADQTGGAFDVTCRPVLLVWRRAGKTKKLPSESALAAARAACGWDKIVLTATGARKTLAGAAVDLGGIAKGYAIDQAARALQKAGALGGIVDVGGDVRCFGRRAGGGKWRVGVRDPFHPRGEKLLAALAVHDTSVCTSGNYFRFVEIDGVRHSHIIDPRTGRSADAAPSVTVVADKAAIADAWATALSVLGPAGLTRLPKDGSVRAMIVTGSAKKFTVHVSQGFADLFLDPPPWPVKTVKPLGPAADRATPATRPGKATTRPAGAGKATAGGSE